MTILTARDLAETLVERTDVSEIRLVCDEAGWAAYAMGGSGRLLAASEQPHAHSPLAALVDLRRTLHDR